MNGMFTRDGDEPSVDVDSFFWRQVVAQSPLARTPGTPYDDGWRATNRLLVSDGAQASTSATCCCATTAVAASTRSRAPPDSTSTRTAAPSPCSTTTAMATRTCVLMAPRSSPQLRLFRNDFAAGHARARAPPDRHEEQPRRGRGARDRRDRPGPRHADRQAGSGFISQHSKELLFGLGRSQRIVEGDDRVAERPRPDVSGRSPQPSRLRSRKAGTPLRSRAVPEGRAPPSCAGTPAPTDAHDPRLGRRPGSTSPFPRPTSRCGTSTVRSIRSPRWPAGPRWSCFWATWAPPSRAALADAVARSAQALAAAGASILAVAVDAPEDEAKVRAVAQGLGLPVMIAERRGGRHLQPPPPLPLRSTRGPASADAVPGERAGRDRQGLPRADRRRAGRRGRPGDRGVRRPSAWRGPCPSRGRSTRARASAATSSTGWSSPSRASTRPRWSRSSASRRSTRARSPSTTSARCT